MNQKEITVILYGCHYPRSDWRYDLDKEALADFFSEFEKELAPLGVLLKYMEDENITLKVSGYGDLLNAVRIRSPKDGITSLCLSTIVGASPNADLLEDIRRGVNRVAFAPETIEPEDGGKIVCHNCGCGC